VAAYRVPFARGARKELERLKEPLRSRILGRSVSRIQGLATIRRPHGGQNLAGDEDAYRIRQGLRRVAYAVDDEACAVEVVEIAVRWIGNAPWPADCRLPAIRWRYVRSQCDHEVTL
jgi:mRNA-degrading endonuclease RelE of RelBE toxin-antitoxin system